MTQLASLTVMALSALLMQDTCSCYEELRTIQMARAADDFLSEALRTELSLREKQLVRELNHLRNVRLALMKDALVTIVPGGDA